MAKIIKVENLSYSYPVSADSDGAEKVDAVKNVSFDIEEGSFVAVLGHNGSGKSTLAKLLSMILSPDSGKIYINGRETTADGITDDDIYEIRRDIGMVFQNPDNQIVATVVEEDVAFGPENLGVPPSEIRERVDRALDTVGMRKYARHTPSRLSGGQKQRIAIAGIIAMMPRCIIFDESTAMLDPMGRREVMETIERLNQENNITAIMITHYMNEATRADRVIVMNKGEIMADGTPEQIFSEVDEMWNAGLDVPQTTEFMYGLEKIGLGEMPLAKFAVEKCADAISSAMKAYAERNK